jgi:hypothetical protein
MGHKVSQGLEELKRNGRKMFSFFLSSCLVDSFVSSDYAAFVTGGICKAYAYLE